MDFYLINHLAIKYYKPWKQKRNSCLKRIRIVCGTIYYSLLSPDSRKRLKTIYFLELMVKDAPLEFHLELFTHSFQRRRQKYFTYFNRYISSNKERQIEIENRLLFLIQIWYDTFMLRYDLFKNIIEVYKKLREEGVIFPLRDVSQKYYIKNHIDQSPIYESFTDDYIYEEPKKLIHLKKYTVEKVDNINFEKQNKQELNQQQSDDLNQQVIIKIIKQYKNMKKNQYTNIQGYLIRIRNIKLT